jgi:uncharacterized Zn-finger protein
MSNFKTCNTNTRFVNCQGYDQDYDHPSIFLTIDPEINHVVCPYCGKKFILRQEEGC